MYSFTLETGIVVKIFTIYPLPVRYVFPEHDSFARFALTLYQAKA